MELSVSLTPDEGAFLDRYAQEHGVTSGSAVIQHALVLRASEPGSAYPQDWDEWEDSADPQLWDAVVGDGVRPRHEG